MQRLLTSFTNPVFHVVLFCKNLSILLYSFRHCFKRGSREDLGKSGYNLVILNNSIFIKMFANPAWFTVVTIVFMYLFIKQRFRLLLT